MDGSVFNEDIEREIAESKPRITEVPLDEHGLGRDQEHRKRHYEHIRSDRGGNAKSEFTQGHHQPAQAE